MVELFVMVYSMADTDLRGVCIFLKIQIYVYWVQGSLDSYKF